eukprot:TRINITY_DN2528_c0_g1_i3.p1 TRINITY_DN2528_c0_g1~~TRINITY_DN2528_c0_g1_i3.p1  ORF type:complete len:310 (-),score=22.50 TRINITY_DN2528_c0_g1_i3:16-945(-)
MIAFLLLGIVSVFAKSSITLTGTIRDFTPATNPDFERGVGVESLVTAELDQEGKPVLSPGSHSTVSSAADFAQWYRDVEGVNIAIAHPISLDPITDGFYTYKTNNFFPIDNAGFGNYPGSPHNYHFTSEWRGTFIFRGDEIFQFTGNDDFWLFVDNKIALNIGGVHGAMSSQAYFNTLGLVVGNSYEIAFFHAQRHTFQSVFKIATSVLFATNITTTAVGSSSTTETDGYTSTGGLDSNSSSTSVITSTSAGDSVSTPDDTATSAGNVDSAGTNTDSESDNDSTGSLMDSVSSATRETAFAVVAFVALS